MGACYTRPHAYSLTHVQTNTSALTRTQLHTQMQHTFAHLCTHKNTYIHTNTCTPTHAHTLNQILFVVNCFQGQTFSTKWKCVPNPLCYRFNNFSLINKFDVFLAALMLLKCLRSAGNVTVTNNEQEVLLSRDKLQAGMCARPNFTG